MSESAEIDYLIGVVSNLLVEAKSDMLFTEWVCVPISLATVSRVVRQAVRNHFEKLGHIIAYERQMKNGQRLRGFWLTVNTMRGA